MLDGRHGLAGGSFFEIGGSIIGSGGTSIQAGMGTQMFVGR